MTDQNPTLWRFAGVEVNIRERYVRVDGESVKIAARPLAVLALLLEHAQEVVTNTEILESVWLGRIVNEVSVANAISQLRKALRDEDQQIIQTVHGTGYRLVADVQRVMDQRHPARSLGLQKGAMIAGRPHWHLMEQFGSGGQGDVWLAEHVKTGERRVFKFCGEGEDHLAALKREVTLFRLLQRALGEQAGIAKIVEWQFQTLPYFVESVYGGPNLREWIASKGGFVAVDLAVRLELIAKVAEIVAAASSVGVLHKDLKPDNVLVSEVDGKLSVLLCDFGTGLVLDEERLGALGITMLGFTRDILGEGRSGSGTYLYMAPELFSGGTASAQSDVYALGIMLYQLVVGEWRAIASGWEADVSDELLRADIAEATNGIPQRRLPSAQLLADRLRSLPERRRVQAELLRERAHAANVQKALERTKAQRPWILAVGVTLLLGLGISWHLKERERHAAEIADRQRHIATQLNEFLSRDIVRAASPDFGGKYDITLKGAVLNSLPRVSQRLTDDPAVEAALDVTMADTLNTLSDVTDAITLAKRAGDVYVEQYGPNDPRTLSARIDEFYYRLLTGHPAEILPLFRPVFKVVKETLPADDPVVLKAKMIEARIAAMDGRQEESLALMEDLIAKYPKNPEGDAMRSLDIMRRYYLTSLVYLHQWENVKGLVTMWLPHFVEAYGPDSRPTLELHSDLGRAYAAAGSLNPADHHYAEAEAEHKKVLAGVTNLYGPESREAYSSLQDLADLYFTQREWAKSEELNKRIHAAFLAQYGPSSQWTFRPLIYIAISLEMQGKVEEGLSVTKELLDASHKYLTPTDYTNRYVLAVAAKMALDAKHTADASEYINEYQRIVDEVNTPDVQGQGKARLLYLKGIQAQQANNVTVAIDLFTQSSRTLLETVGPDDPFTIDALARLSALGANKPSRVALTK